MTREIKEVLYFENNWQDHSWLYKAQEYLEKNWYSFWSLQRNDEIWVMKWNVGIAKWRNLSNLERATLDWIIDCDVKKWYRGWKVRIALYKENSETNIEKAQSLDIELNAEEIRLVNKEAEEKSNSYNRHILIRLEIKGDLWKFLWEGNDRLVFSSKKADGLVIKVPKHEEGLLKNEEEYWFYMQQKDIEMRVWNTFKNPLAPCFMIWKCLFMEKLKVCDWTDFWLDKNWKLKRFDSF